VKLGLFADAASLTHAAELLADLQLPIVVDPVLSMTAGGYRAATEMEHAYRDVVARLHPILTPNLPELTRLSPGGADELLAAGCTAVIVKDGHGDGADVVDRVCQPHRATALRHPRAVCGPVHGTGCAFGSALAAGLAHGRNLMAAATAATWWVGESLAAMGAPVDAYPRPFVPLPLARWSLDPTTARRGPPPVLLPAAASNRPTSGRSAAPRRACALCSRPA